MIKIIRDALRAFARALISGFHGEPRPCRGCGKATTSVDGLCEWCWWDADSR